MSEREGVLSRAPLIYALSVLRFSTILLMPKLIPVIQHAIRHAMPEFFQLAKGHVFGMPQSSEPNSWAFLDRELQYSCVLANDHLILQSIAYLHFDRHVELFNTCVDAVQNATGGLDVAGMGMRYVDKIEPRLGESLHDYLPEALLPLENPGIARLGTQPGKPPLGISTTTYHFDPQFLHVRCWRQPGMWVPDDVVDPAMVFEIARQARAGGQRFAQSTLAFSQLSPAGALLDTDAFWPLPVPERLATEEIVSRLRHLHTMANTAFRNVATEHAFNVWNG
ncbi:TIGR04255 family protein [Pseudomonas gingeri]|uniref:TIGR04255 family protein n=1 Tax=Pseudomonas gingeri TaxID=117681 RepID=A0A7Y8BIJ0_9PSED|nr:TIGR04255 family protein [Pseudomonas gingeri]NWB45056.1 TIGR04255 family protein [Pseudomonas gingeri]